MRATIDVVSKNSERSTRWRTLRRVFLLLILGAAAYVALSAAVAWNILRPAREPVEKSEGLDETRISGTRGLIPAWVTPGLATGMPKAARVALLLHGYGGSRSMWREAIRHLESLGFEVVAPDFPGHGTNPLPTTSFGAEEARVALDVAHWIRERYGEERPVIVAVGLSMGGAAAWLASEREPQAFDAVFTEGAFADFPSAADQWLSQGSAIRGWLMGATRWFTARFMEVDGNTIVPESAARSWRGRPAMIAHGDRDTLVLKENATRLALAAGCRLWLIEGAGHADGFSHKPVPYCSAVLELAKEAEFARGRGN